MCVRTYRGHMARIAIVGGHGKIAQQLIGQLTDHGHAPVALVRSPDQATAVAELGAEPYRLDIERDDVDAFAAAFDSCQAVVFTAGAGNDGSVERKRTVDLNGSLKSIRAAEQTGIRRFLQVSAINVDTDPEADAAPAWHAYIEAKRDADIALRSSALEWTIIRPGRLTDGPGAGLIELGPSLERGEVARADVAYLLALALDEPRSAGHQWDLVGGNIPVDEALASALTP